MNTAAYNRQFTGNSECRDCDTYKPCIRLGNTLYFIEAEYFHKQTWNLPCAYNPLYKSLDNQLVFIPSWFVYLELITCFCHKYIWFYKLGWFLSKRACLRRNSVFNFEHFLLKLVKLLHGSLWKKLTERNTTWLRLYQLEERKGRHIDKTDGCYDKV